MYEVFLDSVERNYIAAMELEVQFFDAQVSSYGEALDVQGNGALDGSAIDRLDDMNKARERILNSLKTCIISES